MSEQHALGAETTRAELAFVIEDIRNTLNLPLPDRGEAPPFSPEHRAEYDAWFNARRQRFLLADPRYRFLERRHGPEVVAQTDADYVALGERTIKQLLAENKARADEDWAIIVGREMPEPLVLTWLDHYDIEDLRLLEEIAADAERVAEQREFDQRLERDIEGETSPEDLKTYRDLAGAVLRLYGIYEADGHGRDCGFDAAAAWNLGGDDPNSEAAQEAWRDHLWDHVMRDERFSKLAQWWGVDTVQEALHRHAEFERAWYERVMRPNMQAHKAARERGDETPRTEQQMQGIARQHTTLRRMLAVQAGLTDELPEGD